MPSRHKLEACATAVVSRANAVDSAGPEAKEFEARHAGIRVAQARRGIGWREHGVSDRNTRSARAFGARRNRCQPTEPGVMYISVVSPLAESEQAHGSAGPRAGAEIRKPG